MEKFSNIVRSNVVLFVFFSFITLSSPLLAVELPIETRPIQKNLSISIIIPCDIGHYQHLPELLEHLTTQTILPDEVVISLSNVDYHLRKNIDSFSKNNWPFTVKIITHRQKKSAGENRNIAIKNASMDVLICQDADDLPHPQRVEIIKYMFETYEIDHLLHSLISYHKTFTDYEANQIPIYRFSTLTEVFEQCAKRKYVITNGNASFTRAVAKKISYSKEKIGEDTQFNNKVFSSSFRSAVILAKLLMYRANLSVTTPGFTWPDDIDF